MNNNNNTIPCIRFNNFNDAWEQRKVGDIFTVTRGTVLAATKVVTKPTEQMPFPVYSSQTKNDGLMGYYKDFLFENAITWTTDGANAGTVSYRKGRFYSTNVNGVLLSKEGFANKAVAEALNNVAHKFVSKVGNPKLMNNIMEDIVISIPINTCEQVKISELFEQIEEQIDLQQRKLDEIKKLKKSMLQKMFPKHGNNTPEMRFDGFNDAWEQHKVGDIFTVTRGTVLAATKVVAKPTEQMPFPVYSSQTKNDGLMGYYKDFLFENAITWTTDGANAGTVSYRKGRFYSTNVNGVLLSKEGFANKAVAEALNNVAHKFVSKVGNPKLMNNIMEDIVISIPINTCEQVKISELFEQIEEQIDLQQCKLELLKTLKKSMLQKLFV